MVVSGMVIIAIFLDYQNQGLIFGRQKYNLTVKEILVTENYLPKKDGGLEWFGNVL